MPPLSCGRRVSLRAFFLTEEERNRFARRSALNHKLEYLSFALTAG